jgi:uncharacterized protein
MPDPAAGTGEDPSASERGAGSGDSSKGTVDRSAKSKGADKPSKKSLSLGATIAKRWRGWLRSIHRDIGYLAVGLTVIYALSGLAINHLQDWDPNFVSFSRQSKIAPIPADVPDAEAVARVRAALNLGVPRETYRAGDEIHLTYDGREVVVIGDSGEVTDQGQRPRFFLRVANWLHYNRGKKAWTYIADGYAVLLLYLAVSGMFMIKGKLGLKWRGLALVALGAGIPLTYVVLSGGPNASAKKTAQAGELRGPPREGMSPASGTGGAPTEGGSASDADDAPDDAPIERPPVRTPPR